MDAIHDLGGKEGHGPIATEEGDPVFKEPWEKRVFGIFYGLQHPDDWTGDWFRYCRELMPPDAYLTRPYFDQWLQSLTVMLLNSRAVTLSELKTGKSSGPLSVCAEPQTASDVQRLKSQRDNFERPATDSPKHQVGATVRARLQAAQGHTRLPQYIRGQCGIVRRYQGHHVVPDRNVFGDDTADHLYCVEFSSRAIWDEAHSNDTVLLDLWESYLDDT